MESECTKFTKRSRLECTWDCRSTFFVCRSILNLQTGNAHRSDVIRDEQFTSVHGTVSEELFNAEEWNSLIKLGPTGYVDLNDASMVIHRSKELRGFLNDNDPEHPTGITTGSGENWTY
jgi:hypothetical protein